MGGGSSSQTIGYKYYMGMHIIICHSDHDNPVEELQKIYADTRTIYENTVTENTTIHINKPNAFGGEEKEGGVVGYVDVEFGGSDQGQNTYLQLNQQENIPAHRGVLGVVLNRVYLTAISPYPKAWSFLVKRAPARSWYPETADINGGANPAHIIYECLTNSDWGLGAPISLVDDANFRAAADTLFAENFSMSLGFSNQVSTETFLQDNILQVINGILFNDKITGLYKLRLFRDDYDVETLPMFNSDNILSLDSFERPQPAEMINEIVLAYRKRGAKKNTSITAQDMANVEAQEGIVSQTITYVGIDNDELAARVAVRELRQHSTPLAKVEFTANREGFSTNEGDVINFAWDFPNRSIERLTLRVTSIDLGSLTSNTIRFICVEDVFAIPSNSYINNQSSLWVNPVRPAEAALFQQSLEALYWDIQTRYQYTIAPEISSLSCYHKMVAKKPSLASPSYRFIAATATGSFSFVANGRWAPTMGLAANIGHTDTTIPYENADSSIRFVSSVVYAYIGNEIVRVDSIDLEAQTLTVGRGCLDTVAATHNAEDLIIIAEDFDAVDETEYVIGETRRGKALTQTGIDVLNESLAPETSITFVGRQNKPYPPGRFRINTLAYPEEITGDVNVTVSWAHRDRTTQLSRPIISEESGNIGPEDNVTYSIEFYNENDVLSHTQTGLTGTSYEWTSEVVDSGLGRMNSSIRVVLRSARDDGGLDPTLSLQQHDFTFNRVSLPINITAPVISPVLI